MARQMTCIEKRGDHHDPHEQIETDNLLALPACR